METKKKGKKRVTTFDELIESRHGKIGTKKRTDFEIKAKSFAIGEIIKEERRLANMTQDELADKTGTKKSFISRIENGHSDIQLSTGRNFSTVQKLSTEKKSKLLFVFCRPNFVGLHVYVHEPTQLLPTSVHIAFG